MSKKNAILSVSNKQGILDFAEGLHELGWSLYGSPGTVSLIERAELPIRDVSELVYGEAILDHRVVTLSREIAASLLADRNKPGDIDELEARGIPEVDLVCVDMYPLGSVVNGGFTEFEVVEKTDVGGPTLLREAAKGRRIVLSQQQQREPVLKWLRDGQPDDENVRRTLAAVAEQEVSDYVSISARYLGELSLRSGPKSEADKVLRQGIRFPQ